MTKSIIAIFIIIFGVALLVTSAKATTVKAQTAGAISSGVVEYK